jgi:hypothetical protein
MVVVLADSAVAVVVVWVLVYLGASYDIVLGITGAGVCIAGFTNKYGLICGNMGRH